MKIFKILMVMGVLAFSANANANAIVIPPPAPILDPVSIDFGTGTGTGGTLLSDDNGGWIGSGIAINSVNIANATESAADGGYSAVATLSFDTASGTIAIDGTMGVDVSTGLTTTQTLFSGVIDTWSYTDGVIALFNATGGGGISSNLSAFIGEAETQGYTFGEFSMDINGNVRSADVLLAGPSRGVPEVPVPAAAWLFGSGLLGLMGVARRKA